MAKKSEITFHSHELENSFYEYRCGLKADDSIILKKNLPITNHDGTYSGKTYHKGERWKVLPGVKSDPDILWLHQPNGERHTWDDEEGIFDIFQLEK